jgi:hypothetical protein
MKAAKLKLTQDELKKAIGCSDQSELYCIAAARNDGDGSIELTFISGKLPTVFDGSKIPFIKLGQLQQVGKSMLY